MRHETIHATRTCPVCGAGPEQVEPYLSDSRDERAMSASSFASRKVPEFMSHAMVRCLTCDLAYVDRPPSVAELAASYHAADYDSALEAEDAADAYAKAIAPVLARLPQQVSALEIGTGTAAFLERLSRVGFADLVGIEPSQAAIDAAPEHRRGWIRSGIFEEHQFVPESFDLICCFMTLEHVQDPGSLVAEAYRLLRPGGAFVAVTHDRRAWVNRLLGRRSPIVDIEHMQLFSRTSAAHLLRMRGYAPVGGASFCNRYRASYWLRLVPIRRSWKKIVTLGLRASGIDGWRIPLNVGNFVSWGFKIPEAGISAPVSSRGTLRTRMPVECHLHGGAEQIEHVTL